MKLGSYAAMCADLPSGPAEPSLRELREDAYHQERAAILRKIDDAPNAAAAGELETRLEELDREFHDEPDFAW